MNHLPVCLLCIGAFALLACAVERPQENLFGRTLASAPSRALWWAGWAVLAAALAVVVRSQGWALGLVAYSGYTSLAAGLVFCALVVLERRRSARRPGRSRE